MLMVIYEFSGDPPSALTVTVINSGRGQICNCNPSLIPLVKLVDCNDSVAYWSIL